MHVVTPDAIAKHSENKYLGVLVSAKYARSLNEFRQGVQAEEAVPGEIREKLTTIALETVARGGVAYNLTARRRPNDP